MDAYVLPYHLGIYKMYTNFEFEVFLFVEYSLCVYLNEQPVRCIILPSIHSWYDIIELSVNFFLMLHICIQINI